MKNAVEILMSLKDHATPSVKRLTRSLTTLGTVGRGVFSGLTAASGQFISRLGRFGLNTITNLTNRLRRLVKIGIFAVGGAVIWAVKQFADFETAGFKLEAVLKATGSAAGYTYKEMMGMANAFQEITKYSNTAVLNAQAVMATFTQIGRDVFPQAIEAAMNMSSTFGQDLQQSVIQLGTALNDPIRGVGRLRRVGISFTEDQKNQIETLMEANDVLGAQRVILDELAREIGGVARKEVGGLTGSLRQMINALSDVARTIGSALAPSIQNTANRIKKWAQDNTIQIERWAKISVEYLKFFGRFMVNFFTSTDTWLEKWKFVWKAMGEIMMAAIDLVWDYGGKKMMNVGKKFGEDLLVGFGEYIDFIPGVEKAQEAIIKDQIKRQAQIERETIGRFGARISKVGKGMLGAMPPDLQQRTSRDLLDLNQKIDKIKEDSIRKENELANKQKFKLDYARQEAEIKERILKLTKDEALQYATMSNLERARVRYLAERAGAAGPGAVAGLSESQREMISQSRILQRVWQQPMEEFARQQFAGVRAPQMNVKIQLAGSAKRFLEVSEDLETVNVSGDAAVRAAG